MTRYALVLNLCYRRSVNIEAIKQEIIAHPSNSSFTKRGWEPIFTASPTAKIVIIGQAPGLAAQESTIPWNDVSGKTLREWLGITNELFYDEAKISLLPMDFYYPGKNPKGGDIPPRKDFAERWHPHILEQMPDVTLTILVGAYAQKEYLGDRAKKNLTENVRAYKEYLPDIIPIVHPSPLAGRWRAKNTWFEQEVVPALQAEVKRALDM